MAAHGGSRGYFITFGALIGLTGVTVLASEINLGTTANLVIALAIASMKASIVALIFMHLRDDDRFHSVILVSAFLFLLMFVGFTMIDTETRGRLEASDVRIAAQAPAPAAGESAHGLPAAPGAPAPAGEHAPAPAGPSEGKIAPQGAPGG